MTELDVVYVWCGLPENKRCSYTKDLYYSIKSVRKNIENLRRIWIVVDDIVTESHVTQVGIDLDKNIRIVHYSKIIPKTYLPIYWNSNVIESWIWKIRGLSDKFVYMCDDMYIGKRTTSDLFFHRGKPIIRINKGPPNHSLQSDKDVSLSDYVLMWRNAIKKHGINYTRLAHNAMPYRRSLMKKYYKEYKNEVHTASNNKVRQGKKDFNLLRFSGSLSVMKGDAILIATDANTFDYFVESGDQYGIRKIKKLKPQFFCINNTNKNQKWVYNTLENYFSK